jgi:hypothetical protein
MFKDIGREQEDCPDRLPGGDALNESKKSPNKKKPSDGGSN